MTLALVISSITIPSYDERWKAEERAFWVFIRRTRGPLAALLLELQFVNSAFENSIFAWD